MSGTLTPPNVNAPIQLDSGLVNPPWYIFFQKLAAAIAQSGSGGVTEIVAGPGLGGGTITSTGTFTLDLDYFGTAQGNLLFRGPTVWEALPPGNPGQFLSTGGADANPKWVDNPADGVVNTITNEGDGYQVYDTINSTVTGAVLRTLKGGTGIGLSYSEDGTEIIISVMGVPLDEITSLGTVITSLGLALTDG